MKFLSQLLGLTLFSAPVWLGFFLLILGIWIAVKAVRRLESFPAKIVTGAGVVAIVLFVPFLDEIAGRIYLNYLCGTNAGVKVFHTVELPREYWDSAGRPRFKVYEGKDHKTIFVINGARREDSRFEYSMFSKLYSSFLHIDEVGFRLRSQRSGESLGEVVYYAFGGGWLRRNFSLHNTATSCLTGNLDDWAYRIFQPATTR